MTAEQLSLDLSLRPAQGREDFMVAAPNAEAVALIETDSLWPGGRLALCGPAASGKSHLVQVWAARAETVVVPAADLPRLDVPTLAAAGRVAVEDVTDLAGDRRGEAALFHLHNRIVSAGGRLLMTGRPAPMDWGIALPDLRSRVNAAQHVKLSAPDDSLLAAMLEKQFADNHLSVDRRVVPYLLTHMTRSAAEARRLAADINRLSLARRRKVTVPLAKIALADFGNTSPKRHGNLPEDQA